MTTTEWRFIVPVGAPIVELPDDLTTLPAPVYRKPRGGFTEMPGEWCSPRVIFGSDGSKFVEQPGPGPCGWIVTYHKPRSPKTPLGTFIQHFSEGIASGFPWWPVVVYSLRAALGTRRAA